MTPIRIEGTHRLAIVRESKGLVNQPYAVSFYYDGYPDYEWKKGSCGIACDLCDTIEQAIRKAKYYIKKDMI